MDLRSLWNDDPEEVLLELGFGGDEPDLSGRIPARFINHQSQARGISLHVFLEAQKSRLDLENPDVSKRFRQLEVFHQVTTAFSSLVRTSATPRRAHLCGELPPQTTERRRHVATLFRRAAKKISNRGTATPTTCSAACTAPKPLQAPTVLGHGNAGIRNGATEQQSGAEQQAQSQNTSQRVKDEDPAYLHALTETIGMVKETFQMEIHSLDKNKVIGSYSERVVVAVVMAAAVAMVLAAAVAMVVAVAVAMVVAVAMI
ncbi:uncharacterized protein [Takifugu rubripes]|uniref:uncharacterized protein n=1 Tax=Takifugu rubripes TaxID=31033 RepID=UPI001145A062|nr:uncharacterized protein LOC115248337 [Takifugu rubripes]